MNSYTSLLVGLALAVTMLSACDDDPGHTGGSAQPPADLGATDDLGLRTDAGASIGDGSQPPDQGPPPDAGGSGGSDVDPELDLGPAGDAARPSDAGEQDGGSEPEDSGVASDSGPDPGDGGADPVDAGPKPCLPEQPGPEDNARVVLVGMPFSAEVGVDGTEILSLLLDRAGELHAFGVRLDVGLRPRRVAFSPSGQWALVLGEEGELASVRVDGVDSMELVEVVQLPSAGYGDLLVTDGGRTVVVVGSNSTLDGGISTVQLGCDGSLEVLEEQFFPLRLSESLVFVPDSDRAVVCGGQALFDPVDEDDLRVLRRHAAGWEQVAAFDVFDDFIDAARIAISPDGATVLVPNGSPFSDDGAQLSVLALQGDVLQEQRRLLDMGDAREALFAPDGATALVTLGEPGRVVVLADEGDGFVEVDRIRGVGLADQMALVARGPQQGLVLLPSVDPNGGPNIALLRIEGPGRVTDLGQFELGAGIENIPSAIAVTP